MEIEREMNWLLAQKIELLKPVIKPNMFDVSAYGVDLLRFFDRRERYCIIKFTYGFHSPLC
uniref:Uncharacterized protein n=1 Tax=Nelumbo nucifera TaxID=4432 RepID=A0A822XM36_NELNU|nr:TPA_asm: hypothetical protein HUJ06_021734 [Nelumbo nucifera]